VPAPRSTSKGQMKKNNQSEEKRGQRIVLVGASNLGHSVPHFDGTDMVFVPVIKPGWVATVENVVELAGTVKGLVPTTSLFVFDLFGNSSVRFEQFDGTTALPFRSNGKYHLGGKVVVAPSEIFRRVLENVIPVLKEKGNKPCVIVPPLLRYLFAWCCSDKGHCTNMHEKDYQDTLMSGFIQLRTSLIKQLVSHGLTNFKVMDSCCATNCSLTASISERIVELRKVTSRYRNIAERSIACISTMLAGESKLTSQQKPTVHFWRGIRSPRGSLLPKLGSSTPQMLHGRATRGTFRGSSRGTFGGNGRNRSFHPYRKW
jgi:hypothetical protein